MKKFLLLLFVALSVFGGDAVYDNLALGVPGKADTIINRDGYALGYIELHEQPAWVTYKLTAFVLLFAECFSSWACYFLLKILFVVRSKVLECYLSNALS